MSGEELVAALVMNQATGTIYEAEKGSGARRDGSPIAPSGQFDIANSIVGSSGYPPDLGGHRIDPWAASLEICLVADGALDVYGVAQHSGLNIWTT